MTIQFIDEMLQDVADEIRTTKDRVRLAELGAVRAFLKAKQSELFDEMEGAEDLPDGELTHHQRFNRWFNQHRDLVRPTDETEGAE